METLPGLREGIYTSVGIDKEDVLAIAVAKRESDLETARAEADEAIKSMSEELQELNQKIVKSGQDVAKKHSTTAIDAAMTALTKAGFKNLSKEVTSSLDEPTQGSARVLVEVVIKQKENYYSRDSLTSKVKKPLPAALKKLLKERDRLTDDLIGAKRVLTTINKEQGKIALLERRARAQMAVASLNKSKEGKALLTQLNTVTVSKLPALPARCRKS